MQNSGEQKNRDAGASRQIRVLMHNRSNVFTQRGGDTVLMENLKARLEARGIEVVIDLNGTTPPASFDIVHIFNFALPEMIRFFGERAEQAGVPFVVSTLNEDIPSFHNQSIAYGATLMEYVARGQTSDWWKDNNPQTQTVERAPRFDNAWAADHATTLFSNGVSETKVLRRDYGNDVRIREVLLGGSTVAAADKTLFTTQYGISDFILCVGRIETRKNQLMLLKALEQSELPLVLAGGGFSYQPTYLEAVRNFQRKGKTIILDKVSPEMLASAYSAAKIHILPSWYELPGLVSLEAASFGCRIVASDTGTTRDYLGESAWYVDPSNELSIYNAVYAAYYGPTKDGLKEVAMKYSWDKTAEQTLKEYHQILGISEAPAKQVTTIDLPSIGVASQSLEIDALLEQGEVAAREREYNRAHQLFEQASRLDPQSVRAHRARGAVYLAENLIVKARRSFDEALKRNPSDAKSLSGLGMCDLHENNVEGAYRAIVRALEIEPYQLVAILQLVQCSYLLERFETLERVLRRYLAENPHDIEMRYCLAGCLYKQERRQEARAELQTVLANNPRHHGAMQLSDLMNEQDEKRELIKPQPTVLATATFSNNIAELEDAKQSRRYQEILDKSAEYLADNELSSANREIVRCYQAEALVFSSKLAEAEDIYRQILEHNPECSRALCGKGALASSRGQSNEARQYFEQALQYAPSSDVAMAGLGMVEQAGGQFENAWNYYLKANRQNPENGRALYGVIELGYHFTRFQEMEGALTAYLDYHPGDVNYLYALAGCYYRQNKYSQASDEVVKILTLDPTHAHAREMNGLIEAKLAGDDSDRIEAAQDTLAR